MKTVAWSQRKMAAETALHRHDAATAQRAQRDITPIRTEVAGDGIDEFVSDFLPGTLALFEVEKLTGTLQLAPVDDVRSWWLDLDAEMNAVVDQPTGEAANTALSATAPDLLLWIWNRLPDLDRIRVTGDAKILAGWSALTI